MFHAGGGIVIRMSLAAPATIPARFSDFAVHFDDGSRTRLVRFGHPVTTGMKGKCTAIARRLGRIHENFQVMQVSTGRIVAERKAESWAVYSEKFTSKA